MPTPPPRAVCGAPTSPWPRTARRIPRAPWPPPSWSPSRRSTPSRCRSRQLPPGQALERVTIFLRGAGDHVLGQLGRRRRLVPGERFQVVAHVLLVVRGRRHADLVRIGGPEAGRVG